MRIMKKRMWRWKTWFRLVLAGWRPNRNAWNQLKLPESFDVFPEARRVLTEFGNLKFERAWGTLILDPFVGEEVRGEIQEYEKQLGYALYPIGIDDGGDTLYLLIDEDGIIYAMSGDLQPFAGCFGVAIDRLLCGLIDKRALDEDLRAVQMSGRVWCRGSTV